MSRLACTTAVSALIFAASGLASGQVTTWTNTGVGDWFDPGNWTAGVPGPGQQAFFINGGTAQIIGGTTSSFQTFSLGTNSAGAVGYAEIVDSIVNAAYVQVGHHGHGEMTVSGATSEINASFIRLAGNLPGATAEFTINDGTISVTGDITPAWYGTGTFNQHGGDVTCSQIIAGQLSVAQATYNIDGGTLWAGMITVGSQGTGFFNQSGTSSVTTSTLFVGGNGGNGTYTLTGGTLDAGIIKKTPAGGTAIFDMLGGRLIVDTFGQTFLPYELNVNGGTLAPNDLGIGTTLVHGSWSQGPASNLEININSPSSFDKVVVNGPIRLMGKITLLLGAAPAASDVYLVGDNDDVDPIIGEFFGLPEGATVSGEFGGTFYNFAISYVGGDGNDLVLAACLGDSTGDGVIDFDDMNLVLTNWGMTGVGVPGDLDGSGIVDFDDLNLVLANWGQMCV